MFARDGMGWDGMEDGTGAMVLFQVDSTRPVDLTFSFTPEIVRCGRSRIRGYRRQSG